MIEDNRTQRIKHLETVCVIAGGLLVFSYIFGIRSLALPALAILFLGVFFKAAAAAIHFLWMGLAKVLGYINSWILLSLVFFLILVPTASIRKLTHLLKGKKNFTKNSSFVAINHVYKPEDFERMW